MRKFTITTMIALLLFTMIGPIQTVEASAQEEIIYDVLIDRFNNGELTLSDEVDHDDEFTYHGGDILGVTKKLDELDEAGFTTINISSVFENAPKGYHGYWIEDFEEINEQFGEMDDLKELVKEAHDRSMKVTMEFVTNYAAKSHPFTEDEDKADWFTDLSIEPTEETFWLEEVVQFDQTKEAVQDYFIDLALMYQKEANIDGITLHAIDQLDHDFVEKLADELKRKDNNFIVIGTVLDKEASIDPLFDLEGVDAIENPSLMEAIVDVFKQPDEPLNSLDAYLESDQHAKSLLMVDDKTSIRYSNIVRDHGRNALNSWKLALAYVYLTPGTPMIYQGSEVPMYGPGFPESEMLVDFTSADPDLTDVFKKYASLRSQFERFVNGDIEVVAREEGLTMYKLSDGNERIYVAINNDSESHKVSIEDGTEDIQLRSLLHDDTIRMNNGEYIVALERESADV
ncbi:MAG TPA: alpha-amylase family glycosyl hydrolase, partial [Pseudogracilibacillus sp.]|nr:alpha-amylase family glycosyl hydrolase [Pseudogracilibacillus sp.]